MLPIVLIIAWIIKKRRDDAIAASQPKPERPAQGEEEVVSEDEGDGEEIEEVEGEEGEDDDDVEVEDEDEDEEGEEEQEEQLPGETIAERVRSRHHD